MRRFFLVLALALVSSTANASYTSFYVSGSITKLAETTYHLRIVGGLWGNDPVLYPAYPLAAFTVNSDYELSGEFGTPFNPEGGVYYNLAPGYAHAGFPTWRFAGLTSFDFDFNLPSTNTTPRLFMDFNVYADIWYFVLDSPYDQFSPVGTMTGSSKVFADLPTAIGDSNPIEQTPEPPLGLLLVAGFATISLVVLGGRLILPLDFGA